MVSFGRISEVEVVDETAEFVCLADNPGARRRKKGPHFSFFPTMAEAVAEVERQNTCIITHASR